MKYISTLVRENSHIGERGEEENTYLSTRRRALHHLLLTHEIDLNTPHRRADTNTRLPILIIRQIHLRHRTRDLPTRGRERNLQTQRHAQLIERLAGHAILLLGRVDILADKDAADLFEGLQLDDEHDGFLPIEVREGFAGGHDARAQRAPLPEVGDAARAEARVRPVEEVFVEGSRGGDEDGGLEGGEGAEEVHAWAGDGGEGEGAVGVEGREGPAEGVGCGEAGGREESVG